MCSLELAYFTFQGTQTNANILQGIKFSNVDHNLIVGTWNIL